MERKELAALMDRVFTQEILELHKAGYKEYSGGGGVFGNFDRLAKELAITREAVLWTYAMKHKDGIASYIRGHRSQREGVRGRINDLIVYLFILRAMVEDEGSRATG